jgi:ParB family chromosome partitioning protein
MQAAHLFVKELRMSATSRGLGRGLDALFRDSENASGQPQNQSDVNIVPLEALVPNPRQPRKNFAPDALEELAASIRSQGIVQPLLVRPAENGCYEIVAGERRWRAAKLAELTEIPVLVRQLSDMEVMAAALIENLQREDLNPLEEARAMATLREQFGLSQDDLASTLGKSRPAIANTLRLLNLDEEAQEALENGRISAGHARAVLSLGSLRAQAELVRHCIYDPLTVRDAEYAATLWKEEGVFPWLKVEEAEQHAEHEQEQQAVAQPSVDEQEQQTVAQPAIAERQAPQRKKSPLLRNMQKQLRLELKINASISGTETRGRISLGYQSQEEFHALLNRLGIEANGAAGE